MQKNTKKEYNEEILEMYKKQQYPWTAVLKTASIIIEFEEIFGKLQLIQRTIYKTSATRILRLHKISLYIHIYIHTLPRSRIFKPE